MNNEVKRRILAIGAHADDLEVNVGATLLKYYDLGYEIIYVMATNNMSGLVAELQDDGKVTYVVETPVPMMARRKRECDDAARVLGTTPIHLDFPQRHYFTGNERESLEACYGSTVPEGVPENVPTILTASDNADCVESVCNLILEKDPECILTHGPIQQNIEHFATSLLVTRAFWKAVDKGFEGGLLHWVEAHTLHGDFYTRWETFVDGTGYHDRKMELLCLHRCQMPTAHYPDYGHRLLGEWRGKVTGCEMAEPFTWVRKPVRRSKAITGFMSPIMGELTTELIHNSR